jgi:membrane associated rhomboid family serine protease
MMMSDHLPTGTAGRPAGRRTWELGAGDPATVLAGARRALFVMVGVLAVLWVIQIANWADHYALTFQYGIRGRDVASLPHIITAPFLHLSWAHIEGNSGPLLIFGFLAAYRGIAKFAVLTALVVVTSGLAAWFTESPQTVGVGASGVVFGYFGYIMVRGFFDRHVIDMLIGAVMALCFAYQFTVLLPHAGIGWQAHIGGLAGGVLGGWLLRDRRAPRASGAKAPVAGSTAAGGATAAGVTAGGGTGRGATGGGRPGRRLTPAKPAQPSQPEKPAKAGQPTSYTGPRAELHKQLDDLGL